MPYNFSDVILINLNRSSQSMDFGYCQRIERGTLLHINLPRPAPPNHNCRPFCYVPMCFKYGGDCVTGNDSLCSNAAGDRPTDVLKGVKQQETMGFFLSAILSLIGYGWGLALGLIAGYLFYLHPSAKTQKVCSVSYSLNQVLFRSLPITGVVRGWTSMGFSCFRLKDDNLVRPPSFIRMSQPHFRSDRGRLKVCKRSCCSTWSTSVQSSCRMVS